MTADEFKVFARSCRADLVGFAPVERFAEVPPEHHPASIFPEVKTVIVVAKRITRGSLRGVEEGTQFSTYSFYGYNWLEDRFLSITSLKLSEFLEDNRYEAVPLFNLPPEMGPMGVPVTPDRPAPNVLLDFDDAAVRAGLGEIGYLRTLVTPEFGTRQRCFLILTDAELEGTPLPAPQVCERKAEFADYCPLGAVDATREETLCIAGQSMKVASINHAICRECKNGAMPNRRHPNAHPDRLGALCMRSYMVHLEEGGRLQASYVNPFRKRAPWQVVLDREIRDEGDEIE